MKKLNYPLKIYTDDCFRLNVFLSHKRTFGKKEKVQTAQEIINEVKTEKIIYK